MDFMHDRLADGRKIRLLTIVDVFTRECERSRSATASSPRTSSQSCAGSAPTVLPRRPFAAITTASSLPRRSISGPFGTGSSWTSRAPEKPTDNAFAESFNGRVRAELLNPSYFETLAQARRAAGIWRHDYNEIRPHSTLGNRTPSEFALAARNRLIS
jgi:putative transposase